jgi:hypothetical protein
MVDQVQLDGQVASVSLFMHDWAVSFQSYVVFGKDVAYNAYKQGGQLFESNFCHPPTTDNWNETADSCLYLTDQ